MKKEFRKKVIESRKNKSANFVLSNSNLITEKLLQMEDIRNATNIMLYLNFNNEVQTDNLTIKENHTLIPTQITDLKEGLRIGAYGIREPNEKSPTIDIKALDVVIVPAVAYDIHCYRLGYGGGFYDRFLENLRKDAITIGIAFDFQIFDSIPKETHDAQLDYIVTETRIITPNS